MTHNAAAIPGAGIIHSIMSVPILGGATFTFSISLSKTLEDKH